MDTFTELHIISDLHLGGPPGHRICCEADALAGWIRHLVDLPNAPNLGLVLNGDIVDFLADKDATYFDPLGAANKLDVVMNPDPTTGDPAFSAVFDALREFTGQPNRTLILVLGNHDLELALPPIQEQLLRRICADKDARARVRIAFDGEGYRCQVGTKSVHAVHGNKADSWNVVDDEKLRRMQDLVAQGITPPRWIPNGGTQLVIDIMNPIKKNWPFIDLLKPETKDLLLTLAVLAPEERSRAWDAGPSLQGLIWGFLKRKKLLSEEVAPAMPEPASPLALLLADETAHPITPSSADLLRRTEEHFRDGLRPADLVGSPDILSARDWIAGLRSSRSGDPAPSLRKALRDWMKDDQTFEFTQQDDVFERLDREIDRDVDFLVAGHTHLERALKRTRGRGVYFNSGTWIRLIHIQKDLLESDAAFAPVYAALRAGSLEALDAYNLRRRTSVAIWSEGEKVFGELRHVRADGCGAEPVSRSKFPQQP